MKEWPDCSERLQRFPARSQLTYGAIRTVSEERTKSAEVGGPRTSPMVKMNSTEMPELATSRSNNRRTSSSESAKAQKRPVDLVQAIMPEDLFLGMLCLERKRAERSSKGFLLFLVEIEEAGNPERRVRLIKGVTRAVNQA